VRFLLDSQCTQRVHNLTHGFQRLLGEKVAIVAIVSVGEPLLALGLAIVAELICLVILRYRRMREARRARLVVAWFWSGYALFIWAFVSRFGERGSLDWRAGDAPWMVGLAVGALLMVYGMRWVQQRQGKREDALQPALN